MSPTLVYSLWKVLVKWICRYYWATPGCKGKKERRSWKHLGTKTKLHKQFWKELFHCFFAELNCQQHLLESLFEFNDKGPNICFIISCYRDRDAPSWFREWVSAQVKAHFKGSVSAKILLKSDLFFTDLKHVLSLPAGVVVLLSLTAGLTVQYSFPVTVCECKKWYGHTAECWLMSLAKCTKLWRHLLLPNDSVQNILCCLYSCTYVYQLVPLCYSAAQPYGSEWYIVTVEDPVMSISEFALWTEMFFKNKVSDNVGFSCYISVCYLDNI